MWNLLRVLDVLLFVSPSFRGVKLLVSHCETTCIKVGNHRYYSEKPTVSQCETNSFSVV